MDEHGTADITRCVDIYGPPLDSDWPPGVIITYGDAAADQKDQEPIHG